MLASTILSWFYTGIFARGGIRFYVRILNMYSFGFVVEFYLAVVL